MRDLVSRHRVRLVYPLPQDLWIVKLPQSAADAVTRRKSPKHRGAIDVFSELVSFPDLMTHPNFELDVVVTGEETVWRLDGRRRWRRRGWVTVERRLLSVYDTAQLRGPADYASMIPAGLPAEFVTADLAPAIGRPRHVAQQMAYCLRKSGLIEKVGRGATPSCTRRRDGAQPELDGPLCSRSRRTISSCWARASGEPEPPRPVVRRARSIGVEPARFGSAASAPCASSVFTADAQRVRTARWRGATPLLSSALGSAPALMSAAIVAACARGFQVGAPGTPSQA